MSTTAVLLVGLLALAAGCAIGWFLQRNGSSAGRKTGAREAERLVAAARGEAEALVRDAELQVKEALFKAKNEAEERAKERSAELHAETARLREREKSLETRADRVDGREAELGEKERELARREAAAEATARAAQETLDKANQHLESLAKLSKEEARSELIAQVEADAKRAASSEIARIEAETEREAQQRSIQIVATAIQRFASDYVGERTVSVVQLPGDEMKGRIIGREGRNIRAIEAATGVDLIVDDTPEAVILSCFDPVRREVARLALNRLLSDGRIHPARIEEVVKKATGEVQASCREAAEQAVFDLGLHKVHPELVKLLGRLKFRSSYAQNLLQHSIEVGYIAGVMASELGVGVKRARRAGLLHDIGKAVDHEVEGSHAAVGASLAKKFGESPKVVHAIAAHHGEVKPTTIVANLVDAANQLSARRPGARRQRLQSYVQRLGDLESICSEYAGVEHAYALQAGREVRVMVQQDESNDDMAVMLSRDIARRIETELAYPGQIKVCVIRETRASDMAR